MTDPTNKPEDMLKKLSRRNWLRNAAIAATSAVALPSLLTGCTKEQWNHLKNTPHPGGGVGSTPSGWYNLKVTFQNEHYNTDDGYLRPKGGEGLCQDDMIVGGKDKASRFRLHPTEDGWADWEIANLIFIDPSAPYYLTMKVSGWVAQESFDNRKSWKIKNGKLYTNWDYWGDYPMGVEWKQGDLDFCDQGYYVGANLWNGNVATFELVPWE